MRFAEALEQAHDGRISFFTLDRIITPNLTRLARYQLSRWKVPQAVELEDVVQEMRFGVWDAVGRWDPKHGVSIERFVVYQVTDRSKKWIHKQRNALRRDGKAQGRFPTPVSGLLGANVGPDEVADEEARLFADLTAPNAEEQLSRCEWREEARRTLRRVAKGSAYRERIALEAIADSYGDYDEALEQLTPTACFLGGGPAQARKLLARGATLAAAACSKPGE